MKQWAEEVCDGEVGRVRLNSIQRYAEELAKRGNEIDGIWERFYWILRAFRTALNFNRFDIYDNPMINADKLGILDITWRRLIELLIEGGYINIVTSYQSDDYRRAVASVSEDWDTLRITLSGLEYTEKYESEHSIDGR